MKILDLNYVKQSEGKGEKERLLFVILSNVKNFNILNARCL